MANRYERERLLETEGAAFVRKLGRAWTAESLRAPRGRKPCRVKLGMGSEARAIYFPERAARREERRSPDFLERKPLFATGDAGRHGWARTVWANPSARRIYLKRFRDALAARATLPLPG